MADRIRDSIRASCSSPFTSSAAGLSFKRRPTSQINEEDAQANSFKDTATLQDRAARKEIERVRLRKLLNQGKKKRRRLNGDKLGAITCPVDDFHCHTHIPRKSRSVGYRRKGKSWKLIGLRLLGEQIELTEVEKASPLSVVQNENEIEFEIAEVLSGLKKQVSSSDELQINGSGDLTTSHISAALPESTQSKQPLKFVIDLNEPPPLESSLEDDKMEAYPEDEVKSVPEEAAVKRFVLPWKMEVKGELQDLDLGIGDCNKNEKQNGYTYASFQTDAIQYGKEHFEFYSHNVNQENSRRRASSLKTKDEHAYHQIHDPLQSGRMMTVAVSPSSNRNVRIGYPSRAPFLSVLSRNVRTNGERLPFLDPQMCLPIEIPQRNLHTTQAITSQTNVLQQSLFPLHSRSLVLMPSSSNRVAAPSFLDKANFGTPADHELQYRHSEMMIQRVNNNQGDSSLDMNSTSWIKQSGYVLKSCSNKLKNQQQLQAMAACQLKRVSTVNNQHQQVSNDYIFDRSSSTRS